MTTTPFLRAVQTETTDTTQLPHSDEAEQARRGARLIHTPHVEDVPPEEMEKRMAAWSAQQDA